MLRNMPHCWVTIIIMLTTNVLMLWRCWVLSLHWALLLSVLDATHRQGLLLVQTWPLYLCWMQCFTECTGPSFQSMHAAQHVALLGRHRHHHVDRQCVDAMALLV